MASLRRLAAYGVVLASTYALLNHQALAFRADQYAFGESAASDQLLQQTVTRLFQDNNDYLWILSQEGLHRYDGYDVVSFRTSRSTEGSISHQLATDIVQTPSGAIWVSTDGGGLNRLNEEDLSFTALRSKSAVSNEHPLSDYTSTLFLSESGNIWVGYSDGAGFSEFDPDSVAFKHYFLTNTPPDASVRAIEEGANGLMYIAVAGMGVYVLDREADELRLLQPNFSNGVAAELADPTDLAIVRNGSLVITTYENGAYIFDPGTDRLRQHPVHSSSEQSVANEMYTFLEDSSGVHWFGTSGGAAAVSPSGDTTWITSFSAELPNDQVLEIYEGRSGSMWIGTFNGLAQGTPTLFQTFGENDGLSSNNVNAITERSEGEWWIGTERGINIFSAQRASGDEWKISVDENQLLQEHIIMSLARDGDLIWAGSLRSGLFKIDTLSGEISQYTYNPAEPGSLTFNGVTSILPLDNETVLIGTYGGGLNILNKATNQFENHKRNPNDTSSVSDNRVIALSIDHTGAVWVGTQNGLNMFDPELGTFTRFGFDPGDPSTVSSGVILSIIEDRNQNLWVGTRSGGLNVWTSENRSAGQPVFEQYNLGGELPSSDIYGIIEGINGNLWVTHNAGLTRMDPNTNIAINFDESYGLQGPEFNHGAAFKTASGDLLFGGPFGFNVVDPLRDYSDSFNPKLNLVGVRLRNQQVFFDKPYSDLNEIDLENNYQFMSFEFAALDFRRPETTRYRYRIFGLQDDWIDLGSTRQVTISGVPHGRYRLAVQGTNASGRWSDNSLELRINIQPPFWLTWYAYVAYAFLLAFAAFSIWKHQKDKAAIEAFRRKELEERVAERTADLQEARLEAEQAAKVKADFLAAMSHEIRTPMHGMLGMTDLLIQSNLSAQQLPLARAAKSSGKALLELVDSILDYSKAEAHKLEIHNELFSLESLVDEICYLLSERARKSETFIGVVWTSPPPDLAQADAGKLRQILTNLIGNAIKFTANGEVTVSCSCDRNTSAASETAELTISVADTGIGIQSENLDAIFDVFTQADNSTTRKYGGTGLGLAISRELVELLGGSISVTSELGVGSEFTICCPIRAGMNAWTHTETKRKQVPYIGSVDLLFESFSSKAKLVDLDTVVVTTARQAELVGKEAKTVFVHEQFEDRARGLFSGVLAEDSFCILRAHPPPATETRQVFMASPFVSSEIRSRADGNKPTSVTAEEKSEVGASRKELPDSNSSAPKRYKALVVEDVALNQQIVCSMLESLGIACAVANNGKEAVAAIETEKYDIIFMDCQMPVMDGFAATRFIREHESQNGQAPTIIVALTAATEANERERALQAGMNDFIRKPFNVGDLSKAIEPLSNKIIMPHEPRTNDPLGERGTDIASASLDHAKSPTTPVIDIDVFNNLIALDNNRDGVLISRLRQGYIEQVEQKLEVLSGSDVQSDEDALSKTAHAIKSMSANIGALRVRKVAESIERSPEDWSGERVFSAIEEMRNHKKDFIVAFDEKLQDLCAL